MAQGLAGAVGLWFPTGATPISLLCAQISNASSCGNFFACTTPTAALMPNLPLIRFFQACNYYVCAHAQSPSDLLVRRLPQATRGINFAKSCLSDEIGRGEADIQSGSHITGEWRTRPAWKKHNLTRYVGCSHLPGRIKGKPVCRPTSIVWKDIFIAIRQLFLPHWSASYIVLNKLKLNFFSVNVYMNTYQNC